MIDFQTLSELLERNVHPQLYPKIFVMSPNGSLIAYSTPADMLQIRDQAALVAMAWREHDEQGRNAHDGRNTTSDSHSGPTALKALTIESESYNVISRLVQPNLVLVLVGGVFPDRQTAFKITTEREGDPPYPLGDADVDVEAEDSTPLHLQRRKVDKLAEFVEREARVSIMPEDAQFSKPFA